jgi:hypothetical protein
MNVDYVKSYVSANFHLKIWQFMICTKKTNDV